uniref:GDP-fucose protein O-fucosyltransferase 2 n=1 Tax=Mesocestoides corti TaxID=53468 RepID=A0A5K3FR73_MESCO
MQNSSIVTRDLYCLHGVLHAVELAGFLFRYIDEHPETKSIYIGAAENLINGVWSEWSQEYWTVRRSMVFAKHLVDIGDAFRKDVLGSEDEPDRTLRPPSWLHHPWPLSPALGGPYAAVHWRRGDFPESPSVHTAVNQTRQAIRKFQLDDQVSAVYLATDAENEDFLLFKQLLSPWAVYRFAPERTDLVPGELAVIDQWICAHARLFVGSSPSTFTFRIVEEREIMGFHPSSTYNAFCAVPGSDVVMYDDWRKRTDCEGLTPWSIVPEPLYTIHTPPFKNEL